MISPSQVREWIENGIGCESKSSYPVVVGLYSPSFQLPICMYYYNLFHNFRRYWNIGFPNLEGASLVSEQEYCISHVLRLGEHEMRLNSITEETYQSPVTRVFLLCTRIIKIFFTVAHTIKVKELICINRIFHLWRATHITSKNLANTLNDFVWSTYFDTSTPRS